MNVGEISIKEKTILREKGADRRERERSYQALLAESASWKRGKGVPMKKKAVEHDHTSESR